MPEGQQTQYEGSPRHSQAHATGEELMSLIDGELPSFEQRRVEAHLADCPKCRETLQRYRATTSAFASEHLFHSLPTHPPRIPETIPFAIPKRTASRGWPRVSWAASIAVMVSGVLLWQMIVAPPGVSARELIARARLEQQRPFVTVNEPVVQRTVRTTRKVGGVIREQVEFEETWHGAPGRLSRTDTTAPMADQIVEALSPHGCSDYAPLSVGMMECLAAKDSVQLRVRENPEGTSTPAYRLAMDLLPPTEGAPLSCEWTLRASDWRLTHVAFLFHMEPRNVEYSVEELSYRVIDSSLTTQKDPAPSRASIPLVTPQPLPPIQEQEPDQQNAAHVEKKLTILQAIADLGWSAEDEVRFHFSEPGQEEVDVLTTSDGRKEQFLQRLGEIDGVAVRVRTYREAIAGLPATDAPPASASAVVSTMQSEGPLLLEIMAERFGGGDRGRERAIAFGGNVIGMTQALQFQTKWIERVARLFPAEERSLLPVTRRQELQELEANMANRITQEHWELREMVSAVLCPKYCSTPSASALSGGVIAEPREADGAHLVPQGKLSSALDREFALLKVMFVDRAFESVSVEPSTANDAPKFATRWMEASRVTHEAIPTVAVEEESPVVAAASILP